MQVWEYLEHAGIEANPACINAYVQALVYQVRVCTCGQDSSLQLHTTCMIPCCLTLQFYLGHVGHVGSSVKRRLMPSVNPSLNPCVNPRVNPTGNPCVNPCVNPSVNPMVMPSLTSSCEPSVKPTVKATAKATVKPYVSLGWLCQLGTSLDTGATVMCYCGNM